MNRLSVTIVDLLGMLVPGAVMLCGLFFLPPFWISLSTVRPPGSGTLGPLSEPWIAGGIWLAVAYVIGFLLRQISIPLMQHLTRGRWVPQLVKEAAVLDPIFETALGDASLTTSLKDLAQLRKDGDPGHLAKYFHFAKRIVRNRPELWVEAERLEAEMRFLAGLFVPFVLLFLDGAILLILSQNAWALTAIGAGGAAVILYAFPSRRVKEVRYDYFLALVALKYPATHGKAEPDP